MPVGGETATRLHADAGLKARDHVSAQSIVARPAAKPSAVRIGPREVEQVNAGKGNKEATNKRQSVNGIGCVEATEEDERGAQGGSGERNVVERVYAVKG